MRDAAAPKDKASIAFANSPESGQTEVHFDLPLFLDLLASSEPGIMSQRILFRSSALCPR